jgi:hypothetical protein
MRSLAYSALAAGLFAAVLYLGGSALGVWDEMPDVPRAAAEPDATSTATAGGAETNVPSAPTAQTGGAKKKNAPNQDPRAPRERLVAADMAIARSAVLQASDMQPQWRRVRPPALTGPGCPQNDPDLSRFTVTGKASSLFKASASRIETRLKVFANGSQAALYFDATWNRTVLRCVRDGVKGDLRRAGLRPRVIYARLLNEPPVGSKTVHFVIAYMLTLKDGTKQAYPLDMIAFQSGRAVGLMAFDFIPSFDGSRPCPCELDHARVVASRLSRT